MAVVNPITPTQFSTDAQTLTASDTIPTGRTALIVGQLTINSGVTLTIAGTGILKLLAA